MVDKEPPESIKANLPALTAAVQRLSDDMLVFAEDLDAQKAAEEDRKRAEIDRENAEIDRENADRRFRNVVVGGLAILVLLIVSISLVAGYFIDRANDLADDLKDQAYTACLGGNERVAGQQSLWDGLVLNSVAETQKEQEALDKISDYVAKVFAPRDCENLDKQYQRPKKFPDLGLN